MRDTLHKDLALYRKLWLRAGNPGNDFDRLVRKMPIPTASKWECLEVPADKFLQMLEVAPGAIAKMSMIEEFISTCRQYLRGTTQEDKPQVRAPRALCVP